MIYLENTVSAQTVSIPRNDNGGTPSINPRSYQEGYNAGFEAGEDVGYGDGVAYQKSLLSSTAITQNGNYQSENGFSAVSVNVPQTGSSLPLTAITITANTAITETEKAYTGITVNVPQTGYTQQDLDNAYSSGYTNGETVGENNIISTFSAMTATTNGNYGSSAHPLSAITVNVPSGTTNLNYQWFASNGVECSIIPDNGCFTISSSSSETNRTYTIVRTNKQIPYVYKDKVYVGSIYNSESGSDDEALLAVFYNTLTNSFYIEELRDFTSYTTATSQNQITINIVGGYETDWDGMENGNYDGLSYVIFESNSSKTYNDGRQSVISTFSSTTATTNGQYGSSANPLSSITVNVPQTGSSLPLSSITITGNTAITVNDKAYTGITVNVPQTAITSDVKYVDYIEINTSGLVGTGSTHWIFTDNIGNQSRITVNFDFMPLASNASGKHEFIGGPIRLSCNKPISNKKYDLKINGKYYRPWDGIVFNTNTRYNCYFSTETNVNNTAYVIINGNYFEVEYTDAASYARVVLNGSNPINQGETFRTTTGRYYGIKVTSGSTILVDARPALDNNNNPCFYDIISNSYIYHTGNSIPVAGNLLSLEEVFNRYYDYGYNKGKADGYPSGYSSGYSSGYTSGSTDGYNDGYSDCSKNSIIGYRIDGVLLSRIQSISSDTLTIFMDIILPYDDYAVFPFSYSASTEKYIELGYFQNNLRVEGNIANDEVDYYFTNPTPAEGRRVICQININPLINNRINVWLYDFVDGQGTYGALSANSIINLNQLIRIQGCNYNELKIIKNGVLIDDFRYNGNGKIVDSITGIEYGENIVPYNPYSSN